MPRSYATGASPAAASPPAGAGAAPVVAVGAGAGALALTKEAGKQTLWVLGSGLKWVVSTFLGLIIFIAWLEIRSCARDAITGEGEKPVGDADKALVVRAADVARWGCKADQDLERWFKYRDPDGLELTYSFCVDTEGANLDPSWAPALEEAVGCQVEVTVYAADDEAKAKRVYGDYKSVVRDMEEWGAEDGLEVEDRSADFAWGDEHSYSILEGAEGRGAVYVTRKGTRVYRFIAVNAFPQAGSELRTLLEPRFKLLADYDG